MPQSLIIVESPTKVKTIKKYLGDDFDVRASMGHVKDLPKSTLGIDVQNNFEPTYQVIETKKKLLAELKKATWRPTRIGKARPLPGTSPMKLPQKASWCAASCLTT
jgi:DNA topoisomerase-1